MRLTKTWPPKPIYLERREGEVEEIHGHTELHKYCQLIAEQHNQDIDPEILCSIIDTRSLVAETEAMETKWKEHMENPEQSESDESINEDDDITISDFMAWGCRRVVD